jgi:hypothetical protein
VNSTMKCSVRMVTSHTWQIPPVPHSFLSTNTFSCVSSCWHCSPFWVQIFSSISWIPTWLM